MQLSKGFVKFMMVRSHQVINLKVFLLSSSSDEKFLGYHSRNLTFRSHSRLGQAVCKRKFVTSLTYLNYQDVSTVIRTGVLHSLASASPLLFT